MYIYVYIYIYICIYINIYSLVVEADPVWNLCVELVLKTYFSTCAAPFTMGSKNTTTA